MKRLKCCWKVVRVPDVSSAIHLLWKIKLFFAAVHSSRLLGRKSSAIRPEKNVVRRDDRKQRWRTLYMSYSEWFRALTFKFFFFSNLCGKFRLSRPLVYRKCTRKFYFNMLTTPSKPEGVTRYIIIQQCTLTSLYPCYSVYSVSCQRMHGIFHCDMENNSN